jgi:hypothetical protein
MFKKSVNSLQYFDPYTAESLADVLYEMGKDLFSKQHFNMCVKWLQRAYEVLSSQELDKISMDARELRISIIQMSVKGLLALKTPEAGEKSRSLIGLLENEVGDKLIVLLLKLEMLSSLAGDNFDSDAYSDVLDRMIRTVPLNDGNFRLIMFHIKRLGDRSSNRACRVLEDFLKLRVLEQEKEEWLEKVIITRIWITVNQKDSADTLSTLINSLSSIVSEVPHPLRPAAAHAAHTVGSSLFAKFIANIG